MAAAYRKLLFFIFALITFTALTARPALAVELRQAIVHLNSLAPNAPISGQVCAMPRTNVIEGKVAITFPSGLQISPNTSHWETNTDNLPPDVDPWPGLSTNPITISGNTVTFASGDLNLSDLVCFNFTAQNSTVQGASGQATGILNTYTTFNFPLENHAFVAPIGNDKVTISANVPADTNDFAAKLFVLDGTNPYPENSTITFEVRYQSNLRYDVRSFKVQAQWHPGQIEGSGTILDAFEYVSGSATNGYGNAIPVIDPVNRTITWTISELPKETLSSVSFKLRLKNIYTGPQKLIQRVSARSIIGNSSTADSNQMIEYLYSRYNKRVPPPPIPPAFTLVEMSSISNTLATVRVHTSKIAKSITIRYGKKPSSLPTSVTDVFLSDKHEITLAELEPGTTYYFRVYALDEDNVTATSDIYTFKTASLSLAPKINPSSFLVTSSSHVLLAPSDITGSNSLPEFIIPKGIPYEVRFSLEQGSLIKSMHMLIRNNTVLSATTFTENLSTEIADLAELLPGTFVGRLKAQEKIGTYIKYIKISDYYGNITETPIAKVRVVKPITILEYRSRNPVDGARVKLYFFNQSTKIFESVGTKLSLLHQPKTDAHGILPVTLPKGKYRIEVNGIGYKPITQEFTVGLQADDGYPTLLLFQKPYGIFDYFSYYGDIASESFSSLAVAIDSIKDSNRYFNYLAVLCLLLSVIATYFSFFIRTQTPLSFILHHVPFIHGAASFLYIGKAVDGNNKSLPRAQVFLIDDENNHIVDRTVSNKIGIFYFRVPQKNYSFMVVKEGYEPVTIPAGKSPRKPQIAKLYQKHTLLDSFRTQLTFTINTLFGGLFELLLVGSILLEIVFAFTFGWMKVMPFVFGSTVNIWLWVKYIQGVRR